MITKSPLGDEQPGACYITIMTYRRALLFEEIVNEEMQLNDYGKIADESWPAIPDHYRACHPERPKGVKDPQQMEPDGSICWETLRCAQSDMVFLR